LSKLASMQALAAYSQHVEAQFVADLTPAERISVGTPLDWAAKDLVAHLATWRAHSAEELQAVQLGPLPPELEEFDEVNRAIFDETHALSWEAVLERASASWQAFAKALGDLTEGQLSGTGGDGPSGRPLWRRVTVEAGSHPVMHYAEFARRRDGAVAATRWMDGAAPLLLAIDASDEWGAVVHYNLACHYAQADMPDKALDSLRVALDLNPGLAEWSTKDSDLARLHDDPRFDSITRSKR
jgi:hypothetical protein